MTEPTTPHEATPANELAAQPAVLRGVVTIIRAKTGKVETYDLTGTVEPQQTKETPCP